MLIKKYKNFIFLYLQLHIYIFMYKSTQIKEIFIEFLHV